MLEKTLESPLDCKDIQPIHSKGDQSWVFFGRTDAEAETPVRQQKTSLHLKLKMLDGSRQGVMGARRQA